MTARPFTKTQATNGTFNPETLVAYELGIKTDLFDRKLRFNLSGFYNDYKNIQLPLADCALLDGFEPGHDPFPCAAIGNAGDGHMYGLEAEMSAHPVAGLDIDASASWIDGKWTRLDPAKLGNPNNPLTAIQLGDPITTPAWKASAGIQYRAELGAAGSVTPRVDVAYTGRQTLGRLPGSATLDYNPARTLANARITWKNEKEDLSISFEVQNLFDKYYLLPLRFSALSAFAGTSYSTVGRPREWAVSVRKTF